MAIKKSQLYSSLWASCDELRGGMDASQYKDYVLVLLFIKYISDKYAGLPFAPITVPDGSSFKDMVALKWKPSIGDDINKKIIAPLSEANKLSEMPDFNSDEKLGSGDDKVKKLSNLIAIFEDPALDFSKNRTEGDDILGDAYEYLMKNFAAESGKSKWQFYTPAEVSRIIARIIGIGQTTCDSPTVYDPTCGSGSLLLKIADETHKNVQLYWQEMDNATTALARMNMFLHNSPTAVILRENTLSAPLFKDGERLKTFDYVVANPPFSFKSWSNGIKDPDTFGRFQDFGIPPAKNGDYAFLLHIIHSLKTTGKGACILPHGVLFRGNSEAGIRANIIRRGYIKAIIGLPANLFYGTGIPACIMLLDKEDAHSRKGIFMIDASKGFIKDGNKNRLRAQDLHKIVDVCNKQMEIPKYSRMVSVTEIEKHEYNLNIPRYIDSQEAEDLQDIEAHLKWGVPNSDIDDLQNYWDVYPTMKSLLFGPSERPWYSQLKIAQEEIKHAIFSHPEFSAYSQVMEETFSQWRERNTTLLKSLKIGAKPKNIIHEVSEDILKVFGTTHLIDAYDIFEHLMVYWSETMQDDMYLIAVDGWKASPYRIIDKDKKGKEKDKWWACDLVPGNLIIDRYFSVEKQALEDLQNQLDTIVQEMEQLAEENSGEEGCFSDLDIVNKKNVSLQVKEMKGKAEFATDLKIMSQYIELAEKESDTKKKIKELEKTLDTQVISKYASLTESEIKALVVDDKWMTAIELAIKGEIDRISHRLTGRIRELAERYATALPDLVKETDSLANKVDAHLKAMGFVW